MASRLCNDYEKNKILKPNGFKDYRWWSIRDLKTYAPINSCKNPDRLMIEKPLISRGLRFRDIFQKTSRKIKIDTVTTFCNDLIGG